MSQSGVATQLHPLESRVLLSLGQAEVLSSALLVERLGFNQGQCNQAFSWLAAKGLIAERERRTFSEFELTEIGKASLAQGTPEERIVGLLEREGALALPEVAKRLGLEQSEVGSAFGALSKSGLLGMDAEKRAVVADGSKRDSIEAVKALLARLGREGKVAEGALTESERALAASFARKRGASRGVVRAMEREEVSYVFTGQAVAVRLALQAAGVTGAEIGTLTPEILQSGEWREKGFRAYNISLPPQRVLVGRQNPYASFIRDLKDKLASLGFEEFDGPLVETEFWNGDALFMPQFHSARDIHDVYYVKEPTHAREIPEPYLSQVAAAHENGGNTGSLGWRYAFDRTFTRRLILRSQGTVLSAKQLPKATVPGKYFGCVRCFRYDQVDATHLADFYQTEGIVLGEEVNLRTLLGLLTMFAKEVAGAEDIRFVPGYFPFTEPSVEVHMKHPVVGWFELGGSGIFRPEVTKPLGIDVPVLAWGLGIDRMAMMSLGIADIRELFSPNLESVRMRVRRQG
jgi:phenylalanyl-tRNA synthetase alpha chain